MPRPKPKPMPVVECTVTGMGEDGLGVAKTETKVLFVEGGLPGDRVEVQVFRQKPRYMVGRVLRLLEPSSQRVEPVCRHFGLCGGCKWQNLAYETQLFYKAGQVRDALARLGGLDLSQVEIHEPLGAPRTYAFRNKLEFTFTNRRWLHAEEMGDESLNRNGLGFHLPGRFERVVHLDECHLMHPLMNEIREAFYQTALEQNLTFYDVRQRSGYLRNLMIRNTTQGEWMVLLSVSEDQPSALAALMDRVHERVPAVQNLLYTVNTKANDSLEGLDIKVYKGQNRVVQVWDGLSFGISASSFFQTNPEQAEAMLRLVREWCGLKGHELVYDLYTGTGSIALFLARQAGRVVGIEYVEAAVQDARQNAISNQIYNTEFFAGDMAALLKREFFDAHGYPDVVVVDPPRAGMHADVVEALKGCGAERLVYVSCNAATQARDLQALSDTYRLLRYRPVDLFPQTSHIENLALLERINRDNP